MIADPVDFALALSRLSTGTKQSRSRHTPSTWEAPVALSAPERLGLLQFVNILILSVNLRSLARGLYVETLVTEVLYWSLQFLVFKKIMEAKTRAEMFAYVLGGTVGTALAILITKAVWGE